MKRNIFNLKFSLLISALLIFCGNLSAQNNMENTDIPNRVHQLFEYSNTQNWTAMRSAFADTMKMYALTGEVIMNNPDDLIAYFKSNYTKFPNERATMEDLMILGNKVIIKEKITGHGKDNPIYDVMIWEFTGNKISSMWIIFE